MGMINDLREKRDNKNFFVNVRDSLEDQLSKYPKGRMREHIIKTIAEMNKKIGD